MKKIILSLLTIGVLTNGFAQAEFKKAPCLGVHFFFNDFQTAAQLRSEGLANVINNKDWSNDDRMSPGLAVSFMQGLSDHFDFVATASGSFVDYPVPGKQPLGTDQFLLDITAVGNLKLLTDRYVVSPYLSLGAGASKYGGYYGAFIPAGVGLQINILDEAFFHLNAQYRVPVTENTNYHFFSSIGFSGNISRKKTAEVSPLPAAPGE